MIVDRKTFSKAAKGLVWGIPTMLFVDEEGIEFVWPIPHNNKLSYLERENQRLREVLEMTQDYIHALSSQPQSEFDNITQKIGEALSNKESSHD